MATSYGLLDNDTKLFKCWKEKRLVVDHFPCYHTFLIIVTNRSLVVIFSFIHKESIPIMSTCVFSLLLFGLKRVPRLSSFLGVILALIPCLLVDHGLRIESRDLPLYLLVGVI